MQEPWENRFCFLLLFEVREINRFLESCHRDPRKILRAPRYSILETRASNLDARFSIASRIEFRVETVNLHLHGTVYGEQDSFTMDVKRLERMRISAI